MSTFSRVELAERWQLWHKIINSARKICKMELSQRKNPYGEIVEGDVQND